MSVPTSVRWGGQLLLMLLVLEGISRFAISLEPVRSRVMHLGDNGARVAQLQMVIDHAGDNPTGALWSRPLQHHPLRGWTNRPGHYELGFIADINPQGLRSDHSWTLKVPEGKRRILVFGDSFTFGDEVDQRLDFVDRLDRLDPAVEVLNFGVLGYGHDQMYLRLAEELRHFEGDAVVLTFTSCDIDRNLDLFNTYAKSRFVLNDGLLELEGAPVPSPEDLLAAYRRGPRLFDLLRIWKDVLSEGSVPVDARYALTAALLDAFADTAAEKDLPVLFAYVPIPTEYDKHTTYEDLSPRRFFLDWCGARGATCADLSPDLFAAHAAGERLTEITHWSAAGHAVVAAGMERELTALGWLAPPETP